MPRKPDERVPKAKKLFDSGMKLAEIAKKLDILEGTVRRWKSTYKWGGGHPDKNNERSEKITNARNQGEKSLHRQQDEPSDIICENTELTEKQRLFCMFYVKYRNKVKAYQKAFGCTYENACGNANRLWKNIEIQKEIQRLMDEYRNNVDIDIKDLFQWYLDIARADMTDFVSWGQEKVPVMGAFGPIQVKDPKTGKKVPLTKTVNTVKFKESASVDGTLVAEIKQGRDGASIKLADRMKALNWLSDHIDLADYIDQESVVTGINRFTGMSYLRYTEYRIKEIWGG